MNSKPRNRTETSLLVCHLARQNFWLNQSLTGRYPHRAPRPAGFSFLPPDFAILVQVFNRPSCAAFRVATVTIVLVYLMGSSGAEHAPHRRGNLPPAIPVYRQGVGVALQEAQRLLRHAVLLGEQRAIGVVA